AQCGSAHLRVDCNLLATEEVVDRHFTQVGRSGFVADEVAEAGDGAHWQSRSLHNAHDLADHRAGRRRDRQDYEIDAALRATRGDVVAVAEHIDGVDAHAAQPPIVIDEANGAVLPAR